VVDCNPGSTDPKDAKGGGGAAQHPQSGGAGGCLGGSRAGLRPPATLRRKATCCCDSAWGTDCHGASAVTPRCFPAPPESPGLWGQVWQVWQGGQVWQVWQVSGWAAPPPSRTVQVCQLACLSLQVLGSQVLGGGVDQVPRPEEGLRQRLVPARGAARGVACTRLAGLAVHPPPPHPSSLVGRAPNATPASCVQCTVEQPSLQEASPACPHCVKPRPAPSLTSAPSGASAPRLPRPAAHLLALAGHTSLAGGLASPSSPSAPPGPLAFL